MKICIASVSSKNNIEDTILGCSLSKMESLGIIKKENVKFIGNNKESLSKVYNDIIKDCRDLYDGVILVHDDVLIEDIFLLDKIEYCFNALNVGVVGVAGAKKIETLKSPILWHLVGGKSLSGAVSHFLSDKNKNDKIDYTTVSIPTVYGLPSRVVLCDGVFLALNLKKINDGIQFDEKCPAKWHFYDLLFSLTCVKNKIDIITYPIKLTHASSGLSEFTSDWLVGEQYFKKQIMEM